MTLKAKVIILLMGYSSLTYAEERMWLEAKINDTPVHLCFDSSCSYNILTPQAVKKLGLKFITAPTNDSFSDVKAGETEESTLMLKDFDSCKTPFLVFSFPPYEAPD